MMPGGCVRTVPCPQCGRDDGQHKFDCGTGYSLFELAKVTGNPKFHKLLKLMGDLHDKKSHDYANTTAGIPNYYSNFEEAAEFAGVDVDTVFAVMIGIKEARLRELKRAGKTPSNESVADTRLDAAIYAALRASYFMEEK